jgi:hypothetical protein
MHERMSMRPLQLSSCLFLLPAALSWTARAIPLRAVTWLHWTLPAVVATSLVYHGPGHGSAVARAVDMALAHLVVAQHLHATVVCVARAHGAWAVYVATAYGAASFWVVRRCLPRLGAGDAATLDALHGLLHCVMAAGSAWFIWHLNPKGAGHPALAHVQVDSSGRG